MQNNIDFHCKYLKLVDEALKISQTYSKKLNLYYFFKSYSWLFKLDVFLWSFIFLFRFTLFMQNLAERDRSCFLNIQKMIKVYILNC